MEIVKGDIIGNQKLAEIFLCSTQGGMRRSLKTNTLVIISNRIDSIYLDRWNENILYYTGMGKIGDQKLIGNQNLTLYESQSNAVSVHLFEVFKNKEYTYQGQVKLANQPFMEIQNDQNDLPRKVWVFPLELIDKSSINLKKEIFEYSLKEREKGFKRFKNREKENYFNKLKKLIETQNSKKPSKRIVESQAFERNEAVKEYALIRADGKCQLCEMDAPFRKKEDGSPFLEVHHIEYLAAGGDDSVENVAALCPNCHRKMHSLELKEDVNKLKKLALIKL